jgi:hypothetical protein
VSKPRDGFTLLEAVVGLAMVSITALSALEALHEQSRTAERADHVLVASVLAERQLFYLDLLVPQRAQLPDSLAVGRFAPPLQEYAWSASAIVRPDMPSVIELRVRVEWSEGSYAVATHRYSSGTGGATR